MTFILTNKNLFDDWIGRSVATHPMRDSYRNIKQHGYPWSQRTRGSLARAARTPADHCPQMSSHDVTLVYMYHYIQAGRYILAQSWSPQRVYRSWRFLVGITIRRKPGWPGDDNHRSPTYPCRIMFCVHWIGRIPIFSQNPVMDANPTATTTCCQNCECFWNSRGGRTLWTSSKVVLSSEYWSSHVNLPI